MICVQAETGRPRFLGKESLLARRETRPSRLTGAVFLCLAAAMIGVSCSPAAKVNLHLDSEILALVADPGSKPVSLDSRNEKDHIAAYYGNPSTTRNVVDFFARLTGSQPVAEAILEQSVKHKVTSSLAFAIAYEESRFNPNALNDNGASVDRGLFQLNSLSFPSMKEKDAFDPHYNASEGMKFFRHILDLSGNVVSALAMYNAGRTRVSQKGAPVMTLDYISRILNYERNISSLFIASVVAGTPLRERIKMGMLTEGTASRP